MIVLLLMLVLYKSQRAWSLFLFFVCIKGGCNVLPFGTGMLKIEDMSLVYIFIIMIYHALIGDRQMFVMDKMAKNIWYLLLFLIAATFFSWLYYEVPLPMVLQMVRYHLYILAYFVLRRQSYADLLKCLKLLGSLTLICAVLYCFQIPLNRSLLLNPNENLDRSDDYGGFSRFTNIPPYAAMFMFLSVFTGSSFVLWKVRKKFLVPGVYIVMRLLTMGRTAILTNFSALLLGICWKRKTYIKWIVVGCIVMLPVIAFVMESFVNRGTSGDLEGIMRGEYKNYVTGYKGNGEETTMLYRIAWAYERLLYLSERPLPEQLMGMAYISDSSPLVRKYYRFTINGYGGEDDFQILRSYDIAFGNLITQFGILGSIALLNLWIYLFLAFYRNRRSTLAFASLIYLISFFMESIAGMGFTQLTNIVPFFLLYVLMKKSGHQELTVNKIINKQ